MKKQEKKVDTDAIHRAMREKKLQSLQTVTHHVPGPRPPVDVEAGRAQTHVGVGDQSTTHDASIPTEELSQGGENSA